MNANTLPLQTTPLIGRDTELAQVSERLGDPACRLLTIAGPGGVGKTRLAVEAAAGVADRFAAGAVFVDLQPVEPEGFAGAIAGVLQVSLTGREPHQQLYNYLRDKELLLLLDNFEHLLSRVTFLVELLARARSVKLLVTSREALNLRHEWLYPLRGLPVPPEAAPGDLSAYGAVQLFRERARRVRPDFSLAAEGPTVVRICRLVEGLPLALELAASWTRTLSPTEIANEIERNLDFLATPLRDIPERHRSMQAVFNQMWAMLPAEERRVFRRLSVFRGGFPREAAESVAGATLPALTTLLDKCMVRREDRYQVHELLRQFGEEKLQESPEETETVHGRHVDYFTTFLHERLDALHGLFQRRAAREIEAEWDNIAAAWQRAIAAGDVAAIRRGAGGLHYFCQLRSRFLEGATALRAAATRVEQEPDSAERDRLLAELYNHEGWLRIRIGDFPRAQQILTRSHALYAELGAVPPPTMGSDSGVPLAIVALIQGDAPRAVRLCEAARRAAEARDDRQNLAFAHYALASAQLAQGQYAAAYAQAERSCTVAREAGNRWFLTYPLIEWGNVARAMGNPREAEAHFRAAYALKEEFKDPEGMAVTLNHLGELAVEQGDFAEAADLFRQSLALYRDLNDRGGLATARKGLGQVALAQGEHAEAGGHFREALQIAAEIQYWPLVCALFVDAAALLRAQDRTEPAVAFLSLVRAHASGSHATRRRAEQELDACRSEMDAARFAAAAQQDGAWDLERAVVKLISDLAAAGGEKPDVRQPQSDAVEPLTERELDVLRLLVKGHTNAEIAEELVLAVGTVKWYASQIYGKLGVANRTEAAARARHLDLVS